MKKQYLEVGKIVSTQGIKGEVRVQPFSDTADFLLDFSYMFIKQPRENQEEKAEPKFDKLFIEYSRVQKNIVILKLVDINTVEDAQKYRNRMLFINREDIELDENCYFIQDLIGLKMIDDTDNSIYYGEIVDVTQTGANDVYHIKCENGEIVLVPAIAKIIKKTDIDAGIITIIPMRGLFDGDNE